MPLTEALWRQLYCQGVWCDASDVSPSFRGNIRGWSHSSVRSVIELFPDQIIWRSTSRGTRAEQFVLLLYCFKFTINSPVSILVLFNNCQEEGWKDNKRAIKILLFYSKWTLVLSLFYGANNSAMSISVIALLSIKVWNCFSFGSDIIDHKPSWPCS